VDPIFGARYGWDIAPQLRFNVRSDIGGFGIGSSSEFTWSATGVFSWEIWPDKMLRAGYKVIDIDYDDGSGNERVKIDLQYRGPVIGFSFGF
jgi:hypothetical protein